MATHSLSPSFRISQRLSYSGHLCTIRYIGPVTGTKGTWLGVEWDNPTLGKHSGTHNEIAYFTCLSSFPTAASFVRPTRPYDQAQSFLEALRYKYVAEASAFNPTTKKQVFFNGKLAEEVGFEKVAAQQAVLGQLKIVALDGLRVAGLKSTGNDKINADGEWDELVDEIRRTCGKVTELDLSRNLIEDWKDVMGICQGLPELRKLALDGNRLAITQPDTELKAKHAAFRRIEELSLEGMLQTWDEITGILRLFPSLKTLSLLSNNISQLSSPLPTPNLTSLNLSFNPLSSFSAIVPLSNITHLSSLTLQSCSITSLTPLPCNFPALQHLDISSNSIPSLTDLNTLPSTFPSLTSLRCSSNPFYTSLPIEEAHMLTVARVPSITMLNFSRISEKERENAELYYLSRIRSEISKGTLTTSSGSTTSTTLRQTHPLFETLATKHNQMDELAAAAEEAKEAAAALGATDSHGGALINPNSLGARLVELSCHIGGGVGGGSGSGSRTGGSADGRPLTLTLPKTVSIYRLKSLVGRAISRFPREFSLVWETGELDPVGRNIGNPGRVGEGRRIAEAESEDDDKDDDEDENKNDAEMDGISGDGGKDADADAGTDIDADGVKWIRREVELVESTRPLGYWIEGRRATIRIELMHGA